jgi:hypothetical protein
MLNTLAPKNNVINTTINANTHSQPKQSNTISQQSTVIHNNMPDNALASLTQLFEQSSNQLSSDNTPITNIEGLENLENIASLLENTTLENISIEDTNQDDTLSAGDSIILTLKNNADDSISNVSFALTENDVTQFNSLLDTLETDQLTQQLMQRITDGILYQMYQAGERVLAALRENPA